MRNYPVLLDIHTTASPAATAAVTPSRIWREKPPAAALKYWGFPTTAQRPLEPEAAPTSGTFVSRSAADSAFPYYMEQN